MRKIALACGTAAALAAAVAAGEYRSAEEVLGSCFVGAESVRQHRLSLSSGEQAAMEKALGCSLGDVLVGPREKAFTLHEGLKDGGPWRYALVLTARARSEPMRLLVRLSPKAEVESVELLAFYEPPQYRARGKFMAQFEGMNSDNPPRHGKNVRNVAGATITSRQSARAVHLAILLLKHFEESEKKSASPPS